MHVHLRLSAGFLAMKTDGKERAAIRASTVRSAGVGAGWPAGALTESSSNAVIK